MGPRVLVQRAEECVVFERGVVVSIHRAPVRGARLSEIRRAIDLVAPDHPRGLVMLSAFRLSPRFPLGPGFDDNVGELAETLRAIERSSAAIANVIEFGGVRAAAMRLASRAVRTLARPRCAMEQFDRLSDAVVWLRPHADRALGPIDPATYVRLYREADRILAAL